MKTTIEITDDLLTRAKRIAQRDGTTLRELVEDGLRRTLKEREQPAKRDQAAADDGRLGPAATLRQAPDSPRNLRRLRSARTQDAGPQAARMIAVDTNILVYAMRSDLRWHAEARA
ncbi:MAG: type II toxin-antitoxin system VapB family antitoxin [Steroidobacteraceae bacterium]